MHPVGEPVRYISNVHVVLVGVGGLVGRMIEFDSSSEKSPAEEKIRWIFGSSSANEWIRHFECLLGCYEQITFPFY